MKKVTFNSRPTTNGHKPNADAWVNDRQPLTEPTKRLTIDIPLSLHQRVKSQCALQGLKMADVMREFLERQFLEPASREGGDALDRNSVNTTL